jgi:hypothetical protein
MIPREYQKSNLALELKAGKNRLMAYPDGILRGGLVRLLLLQPGAAF